MSSAGFSSIDPAEVSGGRAWWDAAAVEYYTEHGRDLGDCDLLWCPEGVRETSAALLGDVRGARILEVGCGAAQGARWTMTAGALAVGLDSSVGMVQVGMDINRRTGIEVPLVLGDARALPFAADTFDVVFTAYGALGFLPNLAEVHREVARVLRGGGRWVYSAVHPMRWCFPDDPSVQASALTVVRSYFDPTPYAEREASRLVYAEFPHTVADHINSLTGAGFTIDHVAEPQPVPSEALRWGAWSPERGAHIPGTLIVSTHFPD
ncbi:MAG: class I SAM-dependent methyltransferase [Bifidobacteriaceae bacterium]|nr:class I SAM-dependent methyltransferase [Bifidobacteriaceae bacterium]